MLKEKNAIDFSDMINQATNLVKGGYQVHKYKWVIIDEYQDISVARFNLVKAIVDQTGAKLLCVGDDWQSIYRFAGSDITLFTKFDQYFSKPAIMRLEKTYRNSQQLIDITGEFIMRNKNQYKKHLRSEKRMERPIVFISYMDYTVNVVQNAIERVIRDAGEDKTILLLGRTKHDADVFEDSSLFKYDEETGKIIYRNMPDVNIIFLSVHKSKGLEADNVILLNFKNGLLGFPNKISDDMLLGLVLIDSDDFVYAEERRLLYVALTRTRNKAYVLVENVLPSEFYKEFMSGNQVELDLIHDQFEKVHCPVCKTGNMVIRKNPRYQSSFLGCSNYPRCQYTIKDISILRENRRCPECGGFMIRRCGKRRDGTFYDFYGCSNYPTCNHVQNNQKPIETA